MSVHPEDVALAQASLYAALAKAQSEMPAVEKDAVNPHFKSRFTSLDHLIAKTRPVLNRHGLAIVQLPLRDHDGMPVLRTTIAHSDGASISADAPLIPMKQDMQGIGAAISYMRRFAWAAACGIASETDDDGESIAQHTPQEATGAAQGRSGGSGRATAPPKAENGSDGVQLVSDPQKRKIGVLLREKQVDEGVYRAKLATFNVEHTKDLTVPQASALIEWLTELTTVAT